jgi:Acetyltransferase (GNAT) domain
MKAELLEEGSDAWPEFLAEVRHDFYHLPAYVALSARQEAGEARALLVRDRSRATLLPLIIRDVTGGGRDATSPYGYPGPLLRDPTDVAFLRAALLAALPTLQAAGIVSLFARFHPLLNPVVPDGVGAMVRHGETVSIDLSASPEVLWREMASGHRNEINRALRAGHSAAPDDSWTHYETFKRLYRQTMERRSAASHYFFDDVYFDGLRAALGDRLHLWLVSIGDAIAAAGLFAETCGIVQYHLSGADEAFARERPTKLMLHAVRTWAQARGDLEMHLGGGVGAAEDSLLAFKGGFSRRRHPFFTLRLVVDADAYRRLVRARDPAWDPEEMDGFFPLYRKEAAISA